MSGGPRCFAFRHRSVPSRDPEACHDPLSRQRGAREARGSRRRIFHRPGPGTTNGSSPIPSAICRRGTAVSSTVSATGNCMISAPTARFSTGASDPLGKGSAREAAQWRPHQVRPLRDRSHRSTRMRKAPRPTAAGRWQAFVPTTSPCASRCRRDPTFVTTMTAATMPGCRLRFAVGRAQFADPAAGFRSPGAQPGAVRGHAIRPCAGARERLSPTPADGRSFPTTGMSSHAGRRHGRRRRDRCSRRCRRKSQLPRRRGRSLRRFRRRRPTADWWRPFCAASDSTRRTLSDPEKTLRADRRRHAGDRQRSSPDADGARQHQG